MNEYNIDSTTIAEMIEELAQQMEAKHFRRFGEYIIDIPDDLGEGYIRGLNFPNGIGMLEYNCTFKEDSCLNFIAESIHPLKFIYCIQGCVYHRTSDNKKLNEIKELHHVIVSSAMNEGHHLSFKAGLKARLSSLEIDRAKFKNQIDFELSDVNFEFYKILADTNAVNSIYHPGNYSLKIATIFAELDNFKETQLIRTTFLGAKSLEIFTEMLVLYADDLNILENKIVIRVTETKAITEAVEYIQQNLHNLDTIDNIARRVGLNVRKLQEGFKILYNRTVHSFVSEKRLEYAVHLLKGSNHNITEIAELIGISSLSHFSKIFKERYGKTPSEFAS